MAQVFGEVSYSVTFGAIAAEPFGGLALVHLRTDGFAENSGAGMAALSASAANDDIGYSTLGARAAASYVQPNGMILTPRLSASWQHAIGSANPAAALAFQSTAEPFTIAGAPPARDTALIEGGLALQINPQARLGVSYSSQLGRRVQHNSVQGNLVWQF
jgi:outer membrane autotransporter protein